jgi:hypothetical protein
LGDYCIGCSMGDITVTGVHLVTIVPGVHLVTLLYGCPMGEFIIPAVHLVTLLYRVFNG